MSKEKQKFSVSYAKDGVYKNGLRDFLEYRDLGIVHNEIACSDDFEVLRSTRRPCTRPA